MNEAEEINKLKYELAETRGELLQAQMRIMDLVSFLKATRNRVVDTLNKIQEL